ncbi:hypothetical protein M5K25_019144 [Dendrobium thyrsiflorum]|uniref:Uncharacterized protein n=1 Tax=Dendrobium thyrsiflorum TaxID=117978 RepID=A0ABD0UEP0_DENTH
MTCPLTHSPASEQRNPTTGPISSVAPSLPIGFISADLFTSSSVFPAKNISVATGPGATQFAVTFVPLSSFDKILTNASTAAFDVVYAPYPGRFIATSDVVSATILPPPPRTTRLAAS